MTPTPTVSAKEKARGAQERTAFEQWAANEWQNSSPPDNAWKGWIARAQVANRAALSATEGEAEPVAWRRREAMDNETAGWELYLDPVESGEPLYASPPSAPAGVKVKPLEWRPTSSGFCWLAASAVGRYFIEERHSDFRWNVEGWPGSWAVNTFEEASAAAQADYESRIRSSLQPDTQAAAASAPAGEDVALQLRGANAVIAAIERAIPDWRSYRDLVDAVECKMAERRS